MTRTKNNLFVVLAVIVVVGIGVSGYSIGTHHARQELAILATGTVLVSTSSPATYTYSFIGENTGSGSPSYQINFSYPGAGTAFNTERDEEHYEDSAIRIEVSNSDGSKAIIAVDKPDSAIPDNFCSSSANSTLSERSQVLGSNYFDTVNSLAGTCLDSLPHDGFTISPDIIRDPLLDTADQIHTLIWDGTASENLLPSQRVGLILPLIVGGYEIQIEVYAADKQNALKIMAELTKNFWFGNQIAR